VHLLVKDRGRGEIANSIEWIAGRIGQRTSECTEQGLLYHLPHEVDDSGIFKAQPVTTILFDAQSK